MSIGQACGAGVYSLKVFTPNNQNNFEHELYYISTHEVDSIAKYKMNKKNWTENRPIGNGILIDSIFANAVRDKSHRRSAFKTEIKNNIINVLTPELATGLVLISIVTDEKHVSIITNAGGCRKSKNSLILGDSPKVVPLFYGINLEKLQLENFPATIYGPIITINNIKCNWRYLVQPLDSVNRKVKVFQKSLISVKKNKTLFSTATWVDNNNPNIPITTIDNLKNNDSFNLECIDINLDSFCDLQTITERAGAGANIAYSTYLFDPENILFKFSEEFSGYNIEYDLEKNRISSFMKSGVDNYYYSFKNLKENKKEVDFIETVHHYGDTIFYKKRIKDKTIEEKKVVLGEYEDFLGHLERK